MVELNLDDWEPNGEFTEPAEQSPGPTRRRSVGIDYEYQARLLPLRAYAIDEKTRLNLNTKDWFILLIRLFSKLYCTNLDPKVYKRYPSDKWDRFILTKLLYQMMKCFRCHCVVCSFLPLHNVSIELIGHHWLQFV